MSAATTPHFIKMFSKWNCCSGLVAEMLCLDVNNMFGFTVCFREMMSSTGMFVFMKGSRFGMR